MAAAAAIVGAIADLHFDVELDSSVFDSLTGITRAIHICRGNSAGAWNSQGGYEAIAAALAPHREAMETWSQIVYDALIA